MIISMLIEAIYNLSPLRWKLSNTVLIDQLTFYAPAIPLKQGGFLQLGSLCDDISPTQVKHYGNAQVITPLRPEFRTVDDVVLEDIISSQEKLSLETQNDKCSQIFFYSCLESLLNFSNRMFSVFMQVFRQCLSLALFILTF